MSRRWLLLLVVPALVAAAPALLKADGAPAATLIDAAEDCAEARSFATRRVAGKLLQVTTAEATVTYSPAQFGTSAAMLVSAAKGTPKADRAAKVAAGRAEGEALWACATAQVAAANATKDAERAATAAAKAETQAANADARAANADALRAMMDAQTPGETPRDATTTESFSGSCCVQGAFYECPSLEAVDTCSGKFMTCTSGCGLDMDCVERCSETHPIDPSGCSRAPARDGEC